LLGLPAFLILRRCSFDGPAGSAASGALLGIVAGFVLVQRPTYWSTVDWLLEIKGLVLLGGATGLAFWAARTLGLRAGRSKS
jgi:protein-S-isoprenylcysteine O-methyltransferase Ste14